MGMGGAGAGLADLMAGIMAGKKFKSDDENDKIRNAYYKAHTTGLDIKNSKDALSLKGDYNAANGKGANLTPGSVISDVTAPSDHMQEHSWVDDLKSGVSSAKHEVASWFKPDPLTTDAPQATPAAQGMQGPGATSDATPAAQDLNNMDAGPMDSTPSNLEEPVGV